MLGKYKVWVNGVLIEDPGSMEPEECPICGTKEGKEFYFVQEVVGDEVHYKAVCEVCGYKEI